MSFPNGDGHGGRWGRRQHYVYGDPAHLDGLRKLPGNLNGLKHEGFVTFKAAGRYLRLRHKREPEPRWRGEVGRAEASSG